MPPEIAVVVPAHNRPLRLRWLLNALGEQTLARQRFEVVVAHDSTDPAVEELLRSHPLAEAGDLRHLHFAERLTPGAMRNAAWREARAPLIAFTDDDCRPPPEWLERALAAATALDGAIVQGTTLPDPDEEHLIQAAPHVHTQRILPPTPWAQSCNIVYPRALLERVGGFAEEFGPAGDDTDLALRARAAGGELEAAPEVLTYHAVDARSLARHLRSLWRWHDLARLVERHPEVRGDFPLWIFWKRTHVWLPVAVAGALLRRRDPRFGALALPWLLHTLPDRGASPRGRLRSLLELPGRAAVDGTEVAVLVAGSIRHRTLFL